MHLLDLTGLALLAAILVLVIASLVLAARGRFPLERGRARFRIARHLGWQIVAAVVLVGFVMFARQIRWPISYHTAMEVGVALCFGFLVPDLFRRRPYFVPGRRELRATAFAIGYFSVGVVDWQAHHPKSMPSATAWLAYPVAGAALGIILCVRAFRLARFEGGRAIRPGSLIGIFLVLASTVAGTFCWLEWGDPRSDVRHWVATFDPEAADPAAWELLAAVGDELGPESIDVVRDRLEPQVRAAMTEAGADAFVHVDPWRRLGLVDAAALQALGRSSWFRAQLELLQGRGTADPPPGIAAKIGLARVATTIGFATDDERHALSERLRTTLLDQDLPPPETYRRSFDRPAVPPVLAARAIEVLNVLAGQILDRGYEIESIAASMGRWTLVKRGDDDRGERITRYGLPNAAAAWGALRILAAGGALDRARPLAFHAAARNALAAFDRKDEDVVAGWLLERQLERLGALARLPPWTPLLDHRALLTALLAGLAGIGMALRWPVDLPLRGRPRRRRASCERGHLSPWTWSPWGAEQVIAGEEGFRRFVFEGADPRKDVIPPWRIDPAAPPLAELLVRIFEDPAPLLERYGAVVTERGFRQLLETGGLLERCLAGGDEARAARLRVIHAMEPLFAKLFAHHALEPACFLWWHRVAAMAVKEPAGERRPEEQALVEAMRSVLALPSKACRLSALHGLAHLATGESRALLEASVEGDRRLSEEEKLYVERCLAGSVL